MCRSRASAFWLFMISMFFFTGCSPIVRAEQGTATQIIRIDQNETVGQTLTANYAGLAGVEVYLDPKDAAGSSTVLNFHLRTAPTSDVDLASTSLSLRDISAPGFYQLSFPPIANSSQADFYFFIENSGSEFVEFASAPGQVYLDGALSLNQQPQDVQLAFHLVYNPVQMMLGIRKEMVTWVVFLLLFAALFVLPGWALLIAAWSDFHKHNWIERVVFSCGVGLSIYPVFFLWTYLAHIQLGWLYAWAPPLISALYLAWRWIKAGAALPKIQLPAKIVWPDLMFGVLVGFIFFVRFWTVRNLPGGLWGDSYQHTLIVQLLLDHHGLFNDWAPYADLTTFTYHFGFHTWVAVFHWISGVAVKDAVVIIGQILNGWSTILLYPLALFLVHNRWAGVFSVLIAGLLMPVPMNYTNWGRYTQLAGQALLPCAILLLFAMMNLREKRTGLLIINWLVWGALAITHYRILVLAVLILPGYLLIMVSRKYWWQSIKQIIWVGLGAGVLFLPWFIRMFGGKIMALFFLLVKQTVKPGLSPEVEAVGRLESYAAPLLWLMLALVFAWALLQRRKPFIVFLLWWVLIVVAANPGLLLISGNNVITNFSILIAVYILIAPVVGAWLGGLFSWIIERSDSWAAAVHLPNWPRFPWRNLVNMLAVFLLLPAAFLGSIDRARDIQPFTYSLLTRPDIRAFQWIDQHTGQESRFLVNSFLAFYDTVTVGSDGGWWLALLAERGSSTPPINSGFEQGIFPNYQQWVNQLVTLILQNGISSDKVIEELDRRMITHVYIGQTYGSEPAKENLLRPQDLLASPYYSLVYHQDRVWIFEIR